MAPIADIRGRHSWVFDLDGTLTVAVHDFLAIRRLLEVPEGADILGHLAALPEGEALPLYRKLAAVEEELAERTVAAAGAGELLELLRGRGVRLGVLTRNTRCNALRTLERIGLARFLHAADVLGRDEALVKPDPEGILRLAGSWGRRPAEMVMVGDYRFDLEAGRAAGTATVHVDPSRHFAWPELTDVAVGSLEELALLAR